MPIIIPYVFFSLVFTKITEQKNKAAKKWSCVHDIVFFDMYFFFYD